MTNFSIHTFISKIIASLIILFYFNTLLPTFSIMLDPAGDAKHTGRQIQDSLERGISLQCAQALKKALEKKYSNIRVILTRFPGETIYPLQNANFANRLAVDFYVSLNFYPETKTKPGIFLYYFSYGDEFVTKIPDLFFCPFDQAHRISSKTTRLWAQNIANTLQSSQYKHQFDFHDVRGLPFKPLVGVKAPAVALEIGLKEKNDWQKYIEPLVQSLETIVNSQ
ncbi:N-acetylmuramoyl-L-alanine amidase [bacterium]|nr:N-acetylmuramoyl-L-alanine amidase [bacterium]